MNYQVLAALHPWGGRGVHGEHQTRSMGDGIEHHPVCRETGRCLGGSNGEQREPVVSRVVERRLMPMLATRHLRANAWLLPTAADERQPRTPPGTPSPGAAARSGWVTAASAP